MLSRTAAHLMVALSLCISAFGADPDYLDMDTRSEVEELKTAFASERCTQANAQVRARTLWRWMNAYAMTGKTIPVNATQYVNNVMAADSGGRIPSGLLKALDDLIVELTAYDEHPDGIGRVRIDNAGPFVIDSWQTLRVSYEVGSISMDPGAVVLVTRHFRNDTSRWQHTDPAGDNYISIEASDPTVRFTTTTVPVRGMHGGFRGPQSQLAFELAEGALSDGDHFTITYGDRTGGSRGFQIQSYSNDAAPLPLYVDFNRDSVFFTLPTPTYRVVGKEVYAIHGFVPSVVGVNEPFDVSVRCEDEFYNRATGPIPEINVTLNGEPYRSLPSGDSALQHLRNVRIDEPGIYRFGFSSPDVQISGASDPIWVQANPQTRVYWGETHGHCGFAEGQGSADSYFLFGRDDARLDFLTLSEHDIWMDDYEWQQINALSAQYTEQGTFIAFPGYEWTARRDRGGHHNVFFRTPGMDRVPGQDAPTLTELYLGLHAKHAPENVLIIPHAHQAADWRSSDVLLEHLVEIMSAHGTFEWFGNRYLEFGHEVGFISASDDHLSHPGYSTGTRIAVGQRGGLAAVYANELTSDALFDALRNKQTYATSGPRMILDATLNGSPMGTRQEFVAERLIEGRVSGTAPIDTVTLVKNGQEISRIAFAAASLTSQCTVEIGFYSESTSFGRDNPRGYRPWRGTLTVSNASLLGVSAPGFQGRRLEHVRMDPDTTNTVHFFTATRGRMNCLTLELKGVSESTHVEIALESTREYGTAPRRVRPAADLSQASIALSISDSANGTNVHSFSVGRHTDSVSLRVIDPAAPKDRQFRFEDAGDVRPGDYYYLRVRQLDGGLAWSSPFWVGGEPRR